MKTAVECPELARLAEACHTGACNVYALVIALGKAAPEVGFFEFRHHPALKIVLGQLSYLVGESAGPSLEAMEEYEAWRDAKPALSTETATA